MALAYVIAAVRFIFILYYGVSHARMKINLGILVKISLKPFAFVELCIVHRSTLSLFLNKRSKFGVSSTGTPHRPSKPVQTGY